MMGSGPPEIIPDMRNMSAIRMSIRKCAGIQEASSVNAILRIRREQHWARPINLQFIILYAATVPLMILFGAATRPSPGSFGFAFFGSACWISIIYWFNRQHPHRDERDIPERREIDGMVRLAMENLADSCSLEDLNLSEGEKAEVLELFSGEPLPPQFRQAVLRTVPSKPLPDI